jgi:hypothetical protein
MELNPKQLVVERIKQSANVLVTVSNNPSVDQLSAAIGLALMLNKLNKHATAVFSGAVPSTLEFLEPEKTLEKNTDSLRDFIIALDKSKADKLRYKVEDNVVRIFITPYRTSISEKDLDFSQGDFNVDIVIALGVRQREELDQAITAHGRILHDASIISINTGEVGSLGAIDWSEPNASSLSEMLVSISESFQSGLLDGQIATAFLTGIVAETERFSNAKTTPKVMTMSAQLMAAGANQQLIATKLAEPEPLPEEPIAQVEPYMPPTIEVPEQAKPEPTPEPEPVPAPAPSQTPDGALAIDHPKEESSDPAPETPPSATVDEQIAETEDEAAEATDDPKIPNIHIDEHGKLSNQNELVIQQHGPDPSQHGMRVIEPLPAPDTGPKTDLSTVVFDPPEFGGTLSANTKAEAPSPSTDPMTLPSVVQPILSHDQFSSTPPIPTDFSAPMAPDDPESPEEHDQTIRDIEQAVHSPHLETATADVKSARDAVSSAISTQPYDPARPEPIQSLNAQPLDFNLHDKKSESSLPPMPPQGAQGNGGFALPTPLSGTPPPPVPPPMMPPTMQQSVQSMMPMQPTPPQPGGLVPPVL